MYPRPDGCCSPLDPGGLKREALEATQQMLLGPPQKRNRKRTIDFGCNIPFEAVPRTIEEGFRKLGALFAKGDHNGLEHY